MNERTITLTLTENCNLSCIYCYEHNKANNSMTFETAKKIIDKHLTNDTNERVIIDFFGGEPFLEFPLIKQIVDYVETSQKNNKYQNKKIVFFATTNGTLIHNEIKQWLLSKPHFICGLSLDGNKKMHDLNRCNSFDQIDLDFFLTRYPTQGIKMTLSEKSLPHLAEGVIFCHSKGFIIHCNLACGIDWNKTKHKKELEKQLSILINYYLNNPQIEPCSILNYDIKRVGFENTEKTIKKWCGTGTHMHTYDVNGNAYPCQFFMPMSCGAEKAKQAKNITFIDEVPLTMLDQKCQTCLLNPCCPTCYGANYFSTGDIYKKDDGECILQKTIFKANAYFYAKKWEHNLLKKEDEKSETAILNAILKISEEL